METSADKLFSEKQKTILIARTFDMSLQRVWKAWSESESFKKWWGPKNYLCQHCSIDFKVGGRLLASMTDENGKESWSVGTYKVIIPHKKIVMTDNFSDSRGNILPPPADMRGEWADNQLIRLDFEDLIGGTKLHLQHIGLPTSQYKDCILGWNESFDKLTKMK